LTSANWSTFNGKERALTFTSPLSRSTNTISIPVATSSIDGYLNSTDWNVFNNKQPAGNYITSLTGEATGSGAGAASITLTNSSVIGKVLTGINITGGTVTATDSILTGFGKLQNQINGLIGSTIYAGVWNASTNSPTLTSGTGTKGIYYVVSTSGATNLNGITDWKVGDWAIYNGTAWDKVDNSDSVSSVNGQTGAVSLTTDNVTQGSTNLYFSNASARSALSFAAGSGAYNSTTGVITIPTNNNQITNGSSYIALTALSGTAPIGYNSTTGAISITQAATAASGYLSSTDWNTFNGKQAAINGTGFVKASGTTISYDNSTYLTTGGFTTTAINALYGYTPANGTLYLPLTGGTLSGALNGTTATFTSDILANTLTVGLGGGGVATNTAIGYQALLNATSASSYNIAIGYQAMGTGILTNAQNIAIGASALKVITSGAQNTIVGFNAGSQITTGGQNVAMGRASLTGISTQSNNTAIGNGAMQNANQSNNTAIGQNSLNTNFGSYNGALGVGAGTYITNGTTMLSNSTQSLYLGALTKASVDGNTNEIVIGYNAIGNGSNSTTIGNSSITKTIIAGTLTSSGLIAGVAGNFVVNGGSGLLVTRTAAQVLSDIGAASSSSLSGYLPLTGGTLTGQLLFGVNTTNSMLKVGSLEFQPYSAGNNLILDNSYFNGANYKYRANGFASLMQFGDGGGNYVWYTAPSGTAGNNVTFTPVLTLSNAGAATFSGSVTGGAGKFLSGSSTGFIIGQVGGVGTTNQGQLNFGDANTSYNIQSGADYVGMNFNVNGSTKFTISNAGAATISNLAGTGSRMVVASSTGLLSATTAAPVGVPAGSDGQLVSYYDGGVPIAIGRLNMNNATGYVTPTTGTSINLLKNGLTIINPAGTLAALTLTLPSSPAEGDAVRYTITQSVSSLSYSGGTVVAAPTIITGRTEINHVYRGATASWY
jgi:hypothetical protein